MAPAFSKLRKPQTVAVAAASAIAIFLYIYKKQAATAGLKTVATVPHFINEEKKKHKEQRVHVDRRFFRDLWRIIRICIPSIYSPEVFYMVMVAVALLGRTYADVAMIINTTNIESSIIHRKKHLLFQYLLKYVIAMPAISTVNNMLKFGLSELKLRFRNRLTTHLYDQYLNGFTYYKMTNIDNRIVNADQLLTQDVERFCEGIVDLYSNLSKPLVDVFLYVGKLGNTLGYSVPALLFTYLLIAGTFLTSLRRPIVRMTVREQQLEGEYRYVNSRLITNSEEIAFYRGEQRERAIIKHSFEKLVGQLRTLIMFRFGIGFIDNILAKYAATMVGFLLVARPFFDTQNKALNAASKEELVRIYYDNGRYMLQLASAFGRIALAGREMTRLAGFTARMTELITVLRDLNKGLYVRTMLASEKTRVADSASDEETVVLSKPTLPMQPGAGKVVCADHIIKFDNVPLVTPNGDLLIDDMTFEVHSGMNVLVCGPNGCGKSSLFRVLGELWPLFGGTLTKPDKRNLFYIPQRPYMTIGNLRDQVIYPHTREDLYRQRITDQDLEKYLDLVQLKYILDREGGWDSVQDWMDVLSGGEKQRIAMARLFYHKPQFAILDECTSAVSVDVEASMYSWCRQANITLFTVSHRKSLWVHHEYFLQMDGRGAYKFARIDENTKEFGS